MLKDNFTIYRVWIKEANSKRGFQQFVQIFFSIIDLLWSTTEFVVAGFYLTINYYTNPKSVQKNKHVISFCSKLIPTWLIKGRKF